MNRDNDDWKWLRVRAFTRLAPMPNPGTSSSLEIKLKIIIFLRLEDWSASIIRQKHRCCNNNNNDYQFSSLRSTPIELGETLASNVSCCWSWLIFDTEYFETSPYLRSRPMYLAVSHSGICECSQFEGDYICYVMKLIRRLMTKNDAYELESPEPDAFISICN